MVNTDKILGLMREYHFTQEDMAKELHMTSVTFRRRIREKSFRLNEMETLVRLLNITDPCSIFFAE